MKRIASLLLALCLLGILPAAAEEGGPAITYKNDGQRVELTLEGVEERVTAIEVELVLEGSCPDAAFASASEDLYATCRAVAANDRTTVTLYLVSDSLLSGSLSLGTLTPGGAYRLPAQARIKLLDRDLKVLSNIEEQIPLSGTGGNTGGGFGGGSDPGTTTPGGGSDPGTTTPGGSSGSGSGSGGSGSGGSSSRVSRKVQISSSTNGSVSAKPSNASSGTTVTLTITPDSGYVLESIRVTDSRGQDVALTESGKNQRTFKMPAYQVEVHAVFAPEKDEDSDTFVMPFTDIAGGAWCFNEVRYVYEHGLMNGTSATTFTPNATTTRGMIVAILYRMEGSPSAGTAAFSDVNASAYYASAVAWASANGVVNGYSDGTFRPNNPITREQMAAFLYRYAALKGQDVTQRAELNAFTDAPQIASYAVEAIQWANAQGLVNGTSATTLSPKGNATRAQAAVILTRYAQTF